MVIPCGVIADICVFQFDNWCFSQTNNTNFLLHLYDVVRMSLSLALGQNYLRNQMIFRKVILYLHNALPRFTTKIKKKIFICVFIKINETCFHFVIILYVNL
jgi:hypothetical protein